MSVIQFTHGGVSVALFAHRTLDEKEFTPAAHFSDSYAIDVMLSFPEKQFETESQARQYAERRAKELIDTGKVPSKY